MTPHSVDRGAPRSYLYVPGDAGDKLEKVLSRGADAVIIDFEDAVAPVAKQRARDTAGAWLGSLGGRPDDGTELWVRINPGPAAAADLHAVVCSAISGVCVPKASLTELEAAGSLLAALAGERGVDAPGLMALVETAHGLKDVASLAACNGVRQLQLGEYDLGAELGIERGAGDLEFLMARAQLVLASAVAGLDAPVGPVTNDFSDLGRLAESTRALKRLGFGSRACIHPRQVRVVNEVFTPTDADVERARALIAGAERAERDGRGAWRAEDGTMVDEALVRAARRVLRRRRQNPDPGDRVPQSDA